MKPSTLLLTLFLPVIVFSQKNVDLDRFSFTVNVRTIPSVRIDSSYRTYNVGFEATRLMQNYFQELAPEKSVIIDGWKQLPKDGHLNIQIKLDDILPESYATKERVEIIKDKTGKQTGTRSYYYQEVVYTFAATADIVDYKGVQIDHIILADRGYKQVYKSPEFAVRQVAEGYFMINVLKLTGDLYKNCVRRAVNYLSNSLSNAYGYGEATITDFMWIIDSRKHPEYSAHRNAFLTIKDVMFDMRADRPLTDAREKLQPVIKYFESIKKNYPGTSKHDRKIRYASFFNLAVIYYYLDDPQAMMKEASGLVLNDFDARDGRNLEASALRLKNLFESSGIYSRHFPVNVNDLRGPFESQPVVTKYGVTQNP